MKLPKLSKKPFVSICTPTFNRRPFINAMLKCFEHQTYPKDKMEWIIIDDGTDKIEDLVKHIPQIKYFKYDDKLTLGKKRNIAHSKCTGEVIVYMDDDDYYPPERVSHAVETLRNNPKALCAGSSEMHIYFKHILQMYKFGPYGPNHATAATFAFRRELLSNSSYDDDACLAEEKHFLKNYTVPFVQLDALKTILVFSHQHNSFDKKLLLNNNQNKFVTKSSKTVDDFIKDTILKEFYTEDIDNLLELYEPGRPENKPDVLKQTQEMKDKRILQQQQQNRPDQMLLAKIKEQDDIIRNLTKENNDCLVKIQYLEDKIKLVIQQQIELLKCRVREPMVPL
jgi:glycosyltransferase involved in cell wall biosynthesis